MQGRKAPRLKWYWRMIILVLLAGLINLAHNPPRWFSNWLQTAWPNATPGQVGYVAFIATGLATGLCLIALLLVTVWLEKPASIRQFFKLGPIDWRSVGMLVLGTAILDALEIVFLRQAVYEPIRLFLVLLGLPGAPSLETNLAPDPKLAGLNLLLLLLMAWLEAPEEVFFRGYVQNHLQEHIGPNWAALVGALAWDAWHIFAPAEFFRRLLFALLYSLVFRWRQNTTAPAVVHPLLNRLLLLLVILPLR